MNQAFSKIWIVVILAIFIAGGILTWQYLMAPKEEVVEDETADWKIYKNEEYEFEVKYPKEGQISFYEDTASFSYKVETMPFPCFSHFWIKAWDNPSQLSVRAFVFEKYGRFIASEQFIEDFIVSGVGGVRIIKELRLPPGGGAMRNAVFVPKNSKVYEIAHSPDYEVMGVDPENAAKCVEELDKIFSQMFSTFKFIEK